VAAQQGPPARWQGWTAGGPGRPTAALAVLLLGLTGCGGPGAGPSPTSAPTTVVTPTTTTPTSPSGATSPAGPAGPETTAETLRPGAPSTTAPAGPSPSASSPPSAAPGSGCRAAAARLGVRDQVGQLLMVAVTSTGVTDAQERAVRSSRAGSLLLLGGSTAGTGGTASLVRHLRATAHRPGPDGGREVGVLLAADQEGGLVQRLRGPGFSDIPAATAQRDLSDARLRGDAQRWGAQLRRAGIDVDLAPVADVVSKDLVEVNEPIGRLHRGYGPDPVVVGAKVAAFTTGMDRAGVATAVKHFPGLGRVRGNTDTARRVVDTTTTRHDPALRGFTAAVGAGVDMVMVSSAVYRRIDAAQPATFSTVVVQGMVRGDLGFDGVVVSDDLSAAALSAWSPQQRALRFVRAGGDLLVVGDPASVPAMTDALAARADRDPAFARRVERSAGRVLTLKARRGLTRC